MEEEGIGLVLARATELRFKISSYIHKANVESQNDDDQLLQHRQSGAENGMREAVDDEEDDGAETLLSIGDALESLETQLFALQDLQQRQRYQRQAALSEIDYSRKLLLEKLKNYKGKELKVIQEASTFAGETVEHNNDLLLPPYPSRPHSLVMENGFLPEFPSARKFVANGIKKNTSESDSIQNQSKPQSSGKWLGSLVNVTSKAMLSLGVITVLSLVGYGPKLRMKNTPFDILGLFRQPAAEEKRSNLLCPPGKVLVQENGSERCVVKERVEVPFECSVENPDVNHGCG